MVPCVAPHCRVVGPRQADVADVQTAREEVLQIGDQAMGENSGRAADAPSIDAGEAPFAVSRERKAGADILAGEIGIVAENIVLAHAGGKPSRAHRKR